jgi:L-asparaginase
LNAVRVAASKEARGKGVLVVLNDEINAAREVTKTNTLRVETFRTPDFGYLGHVDGDKISFYRTPVRRHTSRSEFDVSGLTELPAVEILYSYVSPSVVLVQALAASGVKGIVMAGTGAGLISSVERDALAKVKGAVIVRSNRTGSGRVPERDDYDALGMIGADNLNPQKARVLLMLALTKSSDLKEIGRIFGEY